jgi:hypothetical protein
VRVAGRGVGENAQTEELVAAAPAVVESQSEEKKGEKSPEDEEKQEEWADFLRNIGVSIGGGPSFSSTKSLLGCEFSSLPELDQMLRKRKLPCRGTIFSGHTNHFGKNESHRYKPITGQSVQETICTRLRSRPSKRAWEWRCFGACCALWARGSRGAPARGRERR